MKKKYVDQEQILSYIDHIMNSGLGKKKALEYIYKFISCTETIEVEVSEERER